MPSLTFQQPENSFFTQIPKQLRTAYLLSLLCVSITALLALIMYTAFPPEIPLFYSLASPEQQVVKKVWVLLIPVIALTIFIVNITYIRFNKNFDTILTQITTWSSTFLLALCLLILIRIGIILSL